LHLDSLGNWRRTHLSSQILPELEGKKVTVLGYVEEIRDLGGVKFVILRDRDGIIQVTIHQNTVTSNLFKKIKGLKRQSVIGIQGVVKKIEKAPRGVEIVPEEIKVLSQPQHPLPLDPSGKMPAELDTRLNARILDLRRPENRAIFKVRHVVIGVVREFLRKKGYIEVNTPKIIASATEGGAALFPIAYYDKEAFLAQSPQLYKEQLVIDFEKVFEIGPIFRAEESHTRRHLSESISIDIEEAFVSAVDVMETLEELIIEVLKKVGKQCEEELKTLKHKLKPPERPFGRYTYDQILDEMKKEGINIPWGEDIATPYLKTLGRLHSGFYFITNWPAKSKPFYIKPLKENPAICGAFDLMYGWLELASGGTRIESKDLLIRQIKNSGLNPSSFEYHLKAFDYGMPPHAGWALGLERLMMVIANRKNIREVILFPRDKFRLTP